MAEYNGVDRQYGPSRIRSQRETWSATIYRSFDLASLNAVRCHPAVISLRSQDKRKRRLIVALQIGCDQRGALDWKWHCFSRRGTRLETSSKRSELEAVARINGTGVGCVWQFQEKDRNDPKDEKDLKRRFAGPSH